MQGHGTPDFWALRDDPVVDPLQFKAFAAAEVIRHMSGAARKSKERERLCCLRDIVAAGQVGRSAQVQVSAVLSRYQRQKWRSDQERGFSAGRSRIDDLCFEILMLSDGKLGSRKLQAIFSPVRNNR